MKANIVDRWGCETGETVEGRTLRDIYAALCGRLDVSGPRGLRAVTADGAEVVASLYGGQSFIRATNGRLVYES